MSKPVPVWMVGDLVQIEGTRWQIRAKSRAGKVVLASMNNATASIWWTTSVSRLPRKAAA